MEAGRYPNATERRANGAVPAHDTLRATPLRSLLMQTALTNAQMRFLRGQAHGLKAQLQIGAKGVSDAVVAEVDGALEHHELIKIRVAGDDRDAREAMIGELAERSGAAVVQKIGKIAVLYRPSKDKRQIVLPRG